MADENKVPDLSQIKICEERRVPPMLMLEAADLAIEENPENAPAGSLEAVRLLGVDSTSKEAFGALLTGRKWQNGRTLKVKHLNGDPAIHQKVERFAKEWEEFANIIFDFDQTAPTPEIKISYSSDNRSWSYPGTEALAYGEDVETMHYGWLKPSTPDDEVRRVVVHEFGHALGMIHEHQHPDVKINWNTDAVYLYYRQMGWSKERVDRNLFAHYEKNETQFDKYDPESIMHYPIDPGLTTDGVAIGWNKVLSETDKRFIANAYPKNGPVDGFPMDGAPPEPGGSSGGSYMKLKW